MKKSILLAFSLFLFPSLLQGSWYWPFDEGLFEPKSKGPRLSELMEPATTNIDAAADFAAEGKFKEAQACYRAALEALEKIESDTNNAERVATPEFATVRNKRAYVNAALDSMLLAEARENAKAVAVTDTTDLEVRLALKPWHKYLPTYEALTNDYRILMGRVAYIETDDEAHKLLNAVTNVSRRASCTANFNGMVTNKAILAVRWKNFEATHAAAVQSIDRMERFAKSVEKRGGVQVFDMSREDVRKRVSACQPLWPKVGESLTALNRHLEGLHDVMLEVAAQCDEAMGIEANTGAVLRVEMRWGGADVDVPEKEDDRGLVKDDGDKRPEVTSQIDTYMERERKQIAKVAKKAEKVKADRRSQRAVQKQVKELLEKDSKSRKARMLMAGEDLRNGDTAAAKEKVRALIDEKPNDGPALNMRAAIEAAEGDLKAAEKTLDQAIQSNPRDYHAYYNMANVYLQLGKIDGARRYYETGRSFGGKKDPQLEKAMKLK